MTTISRAAIFGGSGFIGRYLVKRLAQQGVVMTVVGRHASKAGYIKPMGDVGQITLVNGSTADELLVRSAIDGADTVVNLTGILTASASGFDAVHRAGAARIAQLSAELGVERLLHVSAIGADPNSPSAYAKSKGLGEQEVRAAFPSATILRPSIVFGPEDNFFNRFADMARYFPVLPLIGGGRTRFQPVYVGDVADAAIAALDSPAAQGRTYELGGPSIHTFRELMELLLKETAPDDDSRALHTHTLLTLPFPVASVIAGFAQFVPGSPLTPDQVILLKRDNVVSPDALGLGDLGVRPTAMEIILPTYLSRFRPGGWYAGKTVP
jgi:NADH dehydrogenase